MKQNIYKGTKSNIFPAISAVCGIVEKKQILPVLSNILIRKESGSIHFTSSDMVMQVSSSCSCELGESVSTLIQARKLFDVLRSFPDSSEVSIIQDDNRAVVKIGKSRFTLATLPAADFPGMDEDSVVSSLSITQASLKSMLYSVVKAMAVNDTRHYLNGALIKIDNGKMFVVASDGARLSLNSCDIDCSDSAEIILPSKTVYELIRQLSDTDNLVVVNICEKSISFHIGDTVITSRLIDGKFPDYSRIVPNPDKSLRIELDTFAQAINRAKIISDEKISTVKLSLTVDNLTITTANAEQEQSEESLEINYDDQPVSITFNPSFISDALSSITCDEIKFSFTDEKSPAMISLSNSDCCKHVIMPTRQT